MKNPQPELVRRQSASIRCPRKPVFFCNSRPHYFCHSFRCVLFGVSQFSVWKISLRKLRKSFSYPDCRGTFSRTRRTPTGQDSWAAEHPKKNISLWNLHDLQSSRKHKQFISVCLDQTDRQTDHWPKLDLISSFVECMSCEQNGMCAPFCESNTYISSSGSWPVLQSVNQPCKPSTGIRNMASAIAIRQNHKH